LEGTPWFADLRAELLSFLAGKHDDQVDALGLIGQLLDRISAGQRPKLLDVTQRDDYRISPFRTLSAILGGVFFITLIAAARIDRTFDITCRESLFRNGCTSLIWTTPTCA
jgi:hypothetical protein